jgi:hypothetical protein
MTYPGIAEGFTDQGRFTPDNLIAGEFPRISRHGVVTGKTILPRGSVLGRITDDGRYQLSAAKATDGSEIPDTILAETVDTTHGDQQALVYLAGEFNTHALHLGEGHTVDTISQPLRLHSIFLRHNQPVQNDEE